MFDFYFGFDKPLFLLLLALLPVMWIFSFRSLAGLGKTRRVFALLLRSLVFCSIVFALAEVQHRKTSNKMTVVYLLDQSESIPRAKRDLMREYVVQAVREHRNRAREDRAGVIVFGREAAVETPPFDDDVRFVGGIESQLERTDATDIAAALKLAQAVFPEDSANRVVIVTDGNENLGNAYSTAQLLAEKGVAIDILPVELKNQAEVAVEKVSLPSDVRKGQTVEARVVVSSYAQPTKENPEALVSGKLVLIQQIGPQKKILNPDPAAQQVTLKPGKNVFSFTHEIDQPAVYTYHAVFSADDPEQDLVTQNNEASAYTHVRGKGRVLFIEDWENKGSFDFLVDRLRENNLEVDVQTSKDLFTSLAELQGYDSVVLADVPRSSGEDADSVTSFSDDQISMLVRNTEQMGSGLVMLGGPHSFGVGGWSNTELEKAMPVDFQIKNSKIEAVGALVLMMHASEMAQGNHWQKVVGREAIKALGPMDYCGLVHWSDTTGTDAWLWGGNTGLVRVSDQRQRMLGALGRMTPGDMPQFEPAMQMALAGFNSVNASVKHMIIISDGDPSPPSNRLINQYIAANVKITTVAVGTHGPAGSTPLQNIASSTQGKYYVVTNPKALPKIYQREARRVARPLIHEPEGGVRPQVKFPHEMVQGIDGPLDSVKGFVLTTVKDNPLVEVSLVSPTPVGEKNATVLASWTYGSGRAVAFTTDAGKMWANNWTDKPYYDKLFTQIIRWSMRPVQEEGNFTIAADYREGRVRLVVTALDKDDEFLNFLDMSGAAIGPDLKPLDVKIRQTAPGRYVGELPADASGNYFLTVTPGAGKAPLLTGVNVPYSAEFRDRESNLPLLEEIVKLSPQGGEPGVLAEEELAQENLEKLLEIDPFRHNLARAVSSTDVWPWFLVLGATLFFFDVFIRRVTVGFAWLRPVFSWIGVKLLGRTPPPQPDERMSRLRSRKAAIASQRSQQQASSRFESPVAPSEQTPPTLEEVLDQVRSSSEPPPPRTSSSASTPPEEKTSYTERLLEAKRKAQEKRKKEE